MDEMNKNIFSKVMVIDDDPIEHFISERILQANRFATEVLKFLYAGEALEYLQKSADEKSKIPGLIFLDINMDGMDGYEFMNAFRQLPPTLKESINVVILSSSLILEEISRFYQFPEVKGFLEKPLTKEKLASLVL
jgi:CheY-like chemotaxis protein